MAVAATKVKLPKTITTMATKINYYIPPTHIGGDPVEYVLFRRIARWEYPAWRGFQYNYITDEQIVSALEYPYMDKVDLNLDWEQDYWLMEDTSVPDESKHAIRVAKLIQHIMNGGDLHPITIDTYSVDNCCSCIPNGHHRIRALQYLRWDRFPASLNGIVSELNKLGATKAPPRLIHPILP